MLTAGRERPAHALVSGRARVQARSPAPLLSSPSRRMGSTEGDRGSPERGSLGLVARCQDWRGSSAPCSPVRLSASEHSGSGSSSPAPSVTGASARVPARVSETTCMRCSAWPRTRWGPTPPGPMTSTCCTQESKASRHHPLLPLGASAPAVRSRPQGQAGSLSHARLAGSRAWLHPALPGQGHVL